MSNSNLSIDEKRILMEPEEVDSESCNEMDCEDRGTHRHFRDKFGNVWTEQWIRDLAFRQKVRRFYRLK